MEEIARLLKYARVAMAAIAKQCCFSPERLPAKPACTLDHGDISRKYNLNSWIVKLIKDEILCSKEFGNCPVHPSLSIYSQRATLLFDQTTCSSVEHLFLPWVWHTLYRIAIWSGQVCNEAWLRQIEHSLWEQGAFSRRHIWVLLIFHKCMLCNQDFDENPCFFILFS